MRLTKALKTDDRTLYLETNASRDTRAALELRSRIQQSMLYNKITDRQREGYQTLLRAWGHLTQTLPQLDCGCGWGFMCDCEVKA